MTTSLLDELVIRLGLDTTPLQASAQQALGLLDSVDRKSQTLTEKLTRDTNRLSDTQSQLRRNALGLLSLAAGTRGLAALLQGNSPSGAATPQPTSSFTLGPTAERPKRPPAPLFMPLPIPRPALSLLPMPPVSDHTGSTPKMGSNLYASTALSPVIPIFALEKKPFSENRLSKLEQSVVSAPLPRAARSASVAAVFPTSRSSGLTPPGALSSQPLLKGQGARPANIPQQNRSTLSRVASSAQSQPTAASFLTVLYGKKPPLNPKSPQKISVFPARNRWGRLTASSRPVLSVPPQQGPSPTPSLVLPAPHTVLMQAAGSMSVPQPAPVNHSTTTHIGPVTITVPSGNPQDIAAALRDLSTQHTHTLASLATRSTV